MENVIERVLEQKKDKMKRISDQIWEYAETKFNEFKSSQTLCEALKDEGFEVTKGIANMETAFVASFGSGSPVIAYLGEFDALPELSQEKGKSSRNRMEGNGNGHGCGHNLLGTGALAGAVALKRYMEEKQVQGTVRYYGCPAEEGGSGKTFMVREGVFDDVDVALTWHPASIHGIPPVETTANLQVKFKFLGKPSHAAAAPHLGRDATKGVTALDVGIGLMREHFPPETLIHRSVLNAGGKSPNVVHEYAEVLYMIRAPQISQVNQLYNQICQIAKGAGEMTDTKVEIEFEKACSNYIRNIVLEKVMFDVMQQVGLPEYTDEELKFGREIQRTFSESGEFDRTGGSIDLKKVYGHEIAQELREGLQEKVMADSILPYSDQRWVFPASTDVGDVSLVVPTAQFFGSCFALGTPFHTWQLVSQGATSIAHKGMLVAAQILATTGAELLQNPELIHQAKRELHHHWGTNKYQCPIPDYIQPPKSKERNVSYV